MQILMDAWLSNNINIKDILIGESGYCYIISGKGITIADEENECVMNFENTIEDSKKDVSLVLQA